MEMLNCSLIIQMGGILCNDTLVSDFRGLKIIQIGLKFSFWLSSECEKIM